MKADNNRFVGKNMKYSETEGLDCNAVTVVS